MQAMECTQDNRRWMTAVRYFQVATILTALLLENPQQTYGLPAGFATAFFIGLAVSAATTAAQLLLAPLLTPKPKPIDKDKLSGDVKISAIGEDVPIPEIYGGRFTDGIGGFAHGGIIVWASPVRKVVVTVSGGGGGGKGGPRAAPQREHHYYQDYAVIVGKGPLNVLEIKANTDVIYSQFGLPNPNEPPPGTSWEAEGATLAGGATAVVDGACSGGQKVTGVGGGGTVTWNALVGGNPNEPFELTIFYKSQTAADYPLRVTINNTIVRNITLPNSGGAVQFVTLFEYLSPVSSNSIELGGDVETADIDRIFISQLPIQSCDPSDPNCIPTLYGDTIPSGYAVVSGVRDPNFVNPVPTIDNISLTDPVEMDLRAFEEYNYQPKEDADGMVEAEVIPATAVRIYAGTPDQLPDPLLQAFFNTKYGSGATPAYRHRCLVVIENLEITQYSGIMPNFTFRTEHQTIRTLGAMFEDRAKRAGLADSEIDFSALDAIKLRGVGIMQKQAPRVEMERLTRIYDCDVYESSEGVITGVIPSETVVRQIPLEELEVKEDYKLTEGSKDMPAPVESVIRDDYQLPKTFSVGFFDAANNFETAAASAIREGTVSERSESYDTQIALTKPEAQRFADRELQKLYAERIPLKISTFYKNADIQPTDLIEVEELDGTFTRMRVKAVEGWIPGSLTMTGVTRNILETNPRVETTTTNLQRVMNKIDVPSNIIGTIIDIAILRSTEYTTGYYVAATTPHPIYKWKGATLFVEKAGGYEKVDDILKQATMGITAINGIEGENKLPPQSGGLGIAGVFESEVSIYVDLYSGDLETATDPELADRANTCIVGNELCQFKEAERIDGYPNRWLLTGFERMGKGTSDLHNVQERFVLLNSAVKFIPVDYSEIGVARTYKFVGSGQLIDNVSEVAFTYQGNTIQTSGNTEYVDANYDVGLKDGIIEVSALAAMRTITLPLPTLALYHEPFTIKKVDASANAVRVECGGISIDGAAYFDLLYENESADFVVSPTGEYWLIK
jgi:hypothetical protein